jgi:ubiquinone/menaquinone biosynthesis C-methylase UbiE
LRLAGQSCLEGQPGHISRAIFAVRRRVTGLGLSLLYNELAWLYDSVSWLVSKGRWRLWQTSACLFLPPGGRVLEVGCGPGHVLGAMTAAGHQTFGLDRSSSMLRLAQRRLQTKRQDSTLIQGTAACLPLASETLDALVVTFPTAYVYEAAWLQHAARVLKAGGRLIVVEVASTDKQSASNRCLDGLYRAAGLAGTAPDLLELLGSAGFAAWRETAVVEDSTVYLVLAEKTGARPPGTGITQQRS